MNRIALAFVRILFAAVVVSSIPAGASAAVANPGGATLFTQFEVPGNNCFLSWVSNQSGAVTISPASGKNSGTVVLTLALQPNPSGYSTDEVNVIGGPELVDGNYKASQWVDGKRVAQTKSFIVAC